MVIKQDAASDAAAAKAKAAALAKTKAAIAAKVAASSGVTPTANGSQDFGSASTDQMSWNKTVAGATFDMSKFPVPGLSGLGAKATGAQVLQAFSKMVYQDPGLWQNLRPVILGLGGESLTKGKQNKPWTATDETAVENWLTQLHYNALTLTPNNSATPAYTTPDVYTAFSSGIKNMKTFGTVGNKVAAVPVVPPTVVPATADLTSVAQTAFATTLGRSASPKEAADFATKFQSLVQSFGDAKNDAKKQAVFTPPDQPIQFQQTGQKTPVSSNTVSKDTTGLQAPPGASVAAANFAARTNPTEASAQAAANGLDQFLGMLKGS